MGGLNFDIVWLFGVTSNVSSVISLLFGHENSLALKAMSVDL